MRTAKIGPDLRLKPMLNQHYSKFILIGATSRSITFYHKRHNDVTVFAMYYTLEKQLEN